MSFDEGKVRVKAVIQPDKYLSSPKEAWPWAGSIMIGGLIGTGQEEDRFFQLPSRFQIGMNAYNFDEKGILLG